MLVAVARTGYSSDGYSVLWGRPMRAVGRQAAWPEHRRDVARCSDGPGALGTSGREDDHDSHPRPEPWWQRRQESC